jgi:hypothetical protein
VPIGIGALRRIHSRVSWMFLPVDRSIRVSPPQRADHAIFSTSSSIDEVTAELPMLALIFTRKLRPMIIGSSSGWLMLAGMIARPDATSSRTNSGVMLSGRLAPKPWPGCCFKQFRVAWIGTHLVEALVLADRDELHLRRDDAAAGIVHLGDVMAGLRAARRAYVLEAQLRERRVLLALATELGARSSIQAVRTSGMPCNRSIETSGSLNGPEVS